METKDNIKVPYPDPVSGHQESKNIGYIMGYRAGKKAKIRYRIILGIVFLATTSLTTVFLISLFDADSVFAFPPGFWPVIQVFLLAAFFNIVCYMSGMIASLTIKSKRWN